MGKSMQHVLETLLFVMNRACSMQHFSNFAKTLKETLRFNFVHSPASVRTMLHKQIQNPSRSAELSPGVFQTSTALCEAGRAAL